MNRKAILPLLMLAGLAMSSATVPAVATETLAPAVAVESINVTADPGAILTADTVAVTTTPAPVEPTAPTAPATEPAPVATTEPVAAPVTTVPVATAAPVTTAPVAAPVAPVVTAPATTEPVESYVAPAPSYECMEDQPCWDCKTMGNKICGNPACKEANRFTIDAAGTCSTAPVGWTEGDVRADGLAVAATIKSGYIASGSNTQMLRREGYIYAASLTIPGVVHVMAGGPMAEASPVCGQLELGDAWAGVGTYCMQR